MENENGNDRQTESEAPAGAAPQADPGPQASDGNEGETNNRPPGEVLLGPDGLPRPKRRRRGKRGGKRHRKKPEGAASANGDAEADGPAAGDETGATEGPARAPRAPRTQDRPPRAPRPPGQQRPRRPAKPRSASAAGAAEGAEGVADGEAAAAPAADGSPVAEPAPARRAPAPRRRPTPAIADATDAAEAAAAGSEATTDRGPDEAGAEDGTAPRKRRRRRGRGGSKKPEAGAEGASEDAKPSGRAPAAKPAPRGGREKKQTGGSTRLAARALRSQQRPRRRPQRLTEDEARRLRGGEKIMLIHEHDDRTQIAVLEEGVLIEHFVARKGHKTSMAGNIFLGKVQNVLPGMEAAFVDFGRGRNGVLYAGEVNYSAEDLEGEAPRIEKALKPGQAVMVQVTKDPIGSKGARLTAQISLAGRYMVLAPEQQLTGISRRLADNERSRLRQILREIRPNGHGVIVRTAAEGASKEALERDLHGLLKIWDGVQKASKKAKAPHLLYAEPELVARVVRDIFSGDFAEIVVDSRAQFDEIRSSLEDTAPDLLEKVALHDGALPIFETYRVTEQLHKALVRKVWLPSGGSIVIDRTEAMTVIDVNTGKFSGKGSSLEDTVYANNLEAAEEVARQLRLRDIGGIIVIDFIDMIDPKNQQEVLRTLKRALSRDKTRSQVFEVSSLGLIEMTRKRVSEGLLDAFSEPCPNCEGRGIVITHEID